MDSLNRPSIEYHLLFDLCAVEVQRHGLPCLLRVPNGFFAYELVRRLVGRDVTDLLNRTDPAWIVVDTPQSFSLSQQQPAGQFQTIVWAEPLAQESAVLATTLRTALAANGGLCVLFSRRMAALLPESKGGAIPMARAGTAVYAALRKANFRTHSQQSFHGPLSLIWWQASIWFGRLGRPALADRCWYAMRAAFSAEGWQIPLATTTLLTAS